MNKLVSLDVVLFIHMSHKLQHTHASIRLLEIAELVTVQVLKISVNHN